MTRVLLTAIVLEILAASTATAQDARFSVGTGLMLPSGDYYAGLQQPTGDYDPGFQFTGTIEVTFPRTPVGVRVDGIYGYIHHQFHDSFYNAFYVNQTLKLNGGTANLVYHIGASRRLRRLYLLAGAGFIVVNNSEYDAAFTAGTGLSVGAGLSRLFVEGRFVSVRTSGSALNFFPVTGGLSFGL